MLPTEVFIIIGSFADFDTRKALRLTCHHISSATPFDYYSKKHIDLFLEDLKTLREFSRSRLARELKNLTLIAHNIILNNEDQLVRSLKASLRSLRLKSLSVIGSCSGEAAISAFNVVSALDYPLKRFNFGSDELSIKPHSITGRANAKRVYLRLTSPMFRYSNPSSFENLITFLTSVHDLRLLSHTGYGRQGVNLFKAIAQSGMRLTYLALRGFTVTNDISKLASHIYLDDVDLEGNWEVAFQKWSGKLQLKHITQERYPVAFRCKCTTKHDPCREAIGASFPPYSILQ